MEFEFTASEYINDVDIKRQRTSLREHSQPITLFGSLRTRVISKESAANRYCSNNKKFVKILLE